MDVINLYWYRLPNGGSNYGDELNPFIIKELSGKKIRYIPYPYKWYIIPFKYLYTVIRKNEFSDFKGVFRSIFANKVLFAIGSTIHKYNRKGIIVWGAGIKQNNLKIDNATFKAVRGYETLKRLEMLSFDLPTAFGDPALLLPLIIPSSVKQKKIGVIPHYIQYDEVISKKSTISEDIILIDLREDIQKITSQITSCEYIISSSLHGLIVAHAYNLPAIWVDFGCKNKLSGDDIKFCDYFTSVKIEPYKPKMLNSLNAIYISKLFEENPNIILPNIDLMELQKSLLKTAPFKLRDKYHNFTQMI